MTLGAKVVYWVFVLVSLAVAVHAFLNWKTWYGFAAVWGMALFAVDLRYEMVRLCVVNKVRKPWWL